MTGFLAALRLRFRLLRSKIIAACAHSTKLALLFRGFVTLTQLNQNSRRYPRSSSHNFEPFSECLGAGLMESSARDQVALQIEVIIDGVVNRQKTLH